MKNLAESQVLRAMSDMDAANEIQKINVLLQMAGCPDESWIIKFNEIRHNTNVQLIAGLEQLRKEIEDDVRTH